MDTASEYISMCRQAKEMHKSIKDGDYYYWSVDKTVHISFTEQHSDYTVHHPEQWDSLCGREIVWLPRQDQLQEMSKNTGIVSFNNPVFDLLFEFDNFVMERRYNSLSKATSIEQIWFAFVMHEKFGKAWNGEDWIKE